MDGAAAAAAAASSNGDTVATAAANQLDHKQRAYCTAIKLESQDLLAEFVNKLSEQDFEPLLSKLHNADNTLSGTDFVSNFRAQLLETLRQDHNHFWETQYVDDNLTCLRDVIVASRQASASNGGGGGGGGGSDKTPAAAWRPTGRTAAEQVSFYRTFLMNAKLTYLQKQMARQPAQQKHLVDELESHRGRVELMQVKREALNKQMALRNVELQAARETLRGLNDELAACSED